MEQERYFLTDAEFNALIEISSNSHMDAWFDLVSDKENGDYVIDLESNMILDFKQAIEWLADGIVEPTWSEISSDYREAIIGLLKKLDLISNYEYLI